MFSLKLYVLLFSILGELLKYIIHITDFILNMWILSFPGSNGNFISLLASFFVVSLHPFLCKWVFFLFQFPYLVGFISSLFLQLFEWWHKCYWMCSRTFLGFYWEFLVRATFLYSLDVFLSMSFDEVVVTSFCLCVFDQKEVSLVLHFPIEWVWEFFLAPSSPGCHWDPCSDSPRDWIKLHGTELNVLVCFPGVVLLDRTGNATCLSCLLWLENPKQSVL